MSWQDHLTRMASAPALTDAGRSARAHDPDRFLTALFAPSARREALFVLIAFNHELVRALEMPSTRGDAGPIAALIRLQWWREVVEGAARRHEIAGPLATMLDEGVVGRGTLLSIIDAREAELGGIATLAEWREIQRDGPGGLQAAFGEVLGERDPARLDGLRSIGAAYGAGAILRHHRSILQAGRCPLPDDLLREAGSSREAVLRALPIDPAVLAPLREAGLAWLAEAGRLPLGRAGIAAALPAILARRDLARATDGGVPGRGVGDRLALTTAWLRGSLPGGHTGRTGSSEKRQAGV